MDGGRPRNTRQQGYAEEFAVFVRGILAQSTPPASQPLAIDKAKIARVNARWQRTPDWKLTTRMNERKKLYEVLYDDENIERLLEGQYKADVEDGKSHWDVVFAATDRRLIFVYNGQAGEHLNELSYGDIEKIEFKDTVILLGLPSIIITGRMGVSNYIIKGTWLEEDAAPFIKCVQRHLVGSPTALVPPTSSTTTPAEPAPPAVASAPRQTRIDTQWQDKSPNWKLSTRKNEREKLYEVLSDDEDIGRLIEGQYKADAKGAERHDVVVAATDRRLIFVQNGFLIKHLHEIYYAEIERVEVNDGKVLGLTGPHITITGRGAAANYVVEVDIDKSSSYQRGMDLFADYVQSRLPESESPDEYWPDSTAPDPVYVNLTNLPEPSIPTEDEFDWKKRW